MNNRTMHNWLSFYEHTNLQIFTW